MRQHTGIMPLPLLAALCGIAFCVWSASGNGLSFCVTNGCSLFQDVAVNGISLWWFGVVGFGVLALLALVGRPRLGAFVAAVCLCLDILLLILMMLTAPCVGCLLVACLFALTYLAFRHMVKKQQGKISRSWIIWLWGALVCVNVGAIFKAEVGSWRMFGATEDTVRLYFSPSCSACREAVTALSGRVNVGFYPVLEEDMDLFKIQGMLQALARGDNMAEALAQVQHIKTGSGWSYLNPDMLTLWFRLMRNKAHVMDADSITVPFLEYHGLPASLVQKAPARESHGAGHTDTTPSTPPASTNMDYTLPIDTDIAGSCEQSTTAPCPEFNQP